MSVGTSYALTSTCGGSDEGTAEKSTVRPAVKREAVAPLQVNLACRLVGALLPVQDFRRRAAHRNLRQSAYQPKALRFQLGESSVAGQYGEINVISAAFASSGSAITIRLFQLPENAEARKRIHHRLFGQISVVQKRKDDQ